MLMTPLLPFRRTARLAALAGGLLALGAASASAQTYNVFLDTTGLIAGDSYAVDFQLNQGGATLPSAVTVGGFLFGGGSAGAAGTIQSSGLASGGLTSVVALGSSAASPFNEFTQDFTPGSFLGFTVSAGQLMAQAGAVPDGFSFGLIDNSAGGALITTNDGSGQNSLFTLTRGAGGAFAAQNFGYTSPQGSLITTTSGAPPAVPEASTTVSLGLLLALGMGGAVVAAKRRKSA